MIKDGLKIKERSDEIYSFLLIGQSNMAGRGEFDEVDPIDNGNCFMLRMGRWQKMREPINPDRKIFGEGTHSGINLGASFADDASKNLNIKVGLIPCADGGTSLNEWMPGGILFDHAVFMAKLAMRTSRLSGILWHQGESDAHSPELAEAYKEKFITMISAMRRELEAEKVPLIIGELCEHCSEKWNMTYAHKINETFTQLTKELPATALVSADGLTLKSDGLHFDSKSLRIFGSRYYEAFSSLI